jgi:2'-5' RNA ligase
MRLFAAIDLPEEIRQGIKTLLPLPMESAREVPLSQLHLTLRFIGETEKSSEIKAVLSRVSSHSFRLALKGIGVFPYAKRPRILWLGFEEAPALLDLQKQIETSLQSLGLLAENRPFSPHLTLARFKFGQPKEVEAFLHQYRDFQSPPWEVQTFQLYSSRLNPNGAVHTVEQSYPLR